MAFLHQKGHIFTILITFSLMGIPSFAESNNDKQALLEFISKVGYNKSRINWNPNTSMCHKWDGVVCSSDNKSRVCELRLPGVGLNGQIPENTIGKLTHLRALSLRNNKLFGSLPSDWANLTALTHLILPNNRLSGPFPECITKMHKLGRLDLSYNMFEGQIPASISNLMLLQLFLQHNQLSGPIPDVLDASILVYFDVSGNNLSGPIPKALSTFTESSFYGNVLLCGTPMPSCNNSFVSPPPKTPPPPLIPTDSDRLPTHVIAIINVICVVAALFFITLLLYCIHKRCTRRAKQSQLPKSSLSIDGEDNSNQSTSKDIISTCELSKNKRLVFFQTGKYSFDLQALLGASAEVLGKGSTGTSYKAEMDDGTTVVVKRMKEVVVSRKEFDTQMELIGQLSHPNVAKLIAYYYCKDEKLVISEYIPSGSLSSLLHASRGSCRKSLDWITRFRIGLTAAKGLHHIHAAAKVPHGNVKSSNILVTQSLEACVSDYGMHSLLGPSTPHLVAGYIAPEVQQIEKGVSFKSDVYSFGVVLLEMLTGKCPNRLSSVGDDGVDLPRWVGAVAEENFATEVFDANVLESGADEEMMAVLQVAMKCVDIVPENRPEMWEVVKMLEMVATGEFLAPVS